MDAHLTPMVPNRSTSMRPRAEADVFDAATKRREGRRNAPRCIPSLAQRLVIPGQRSLTMNKFDAFHDQQKLAAPGDSDPPFAPRQWVRMRGAPERRFRVAYCEKRTDWAHVRWVVVFEDGRTAFARDVEAIDDSPVKYRATEATTIEGGRQ